VGYCVLLKCSTSGFKVAYRKPSINSHNRSTFPGGLDTDKVVGATRVSGPDESAGRADEYFTLDSLIDHL